MLPQKLVLQALLGVALIGTACPVVPSDGTRAAANVPQAQPILPFCELVSHAEKYAGQTVRVNATLYFMMHGFFFRDKGCPGTEMYVAVVLDAEQHGKLIKEPGKEYSPWNFPRIIARGQFRRVTPSRKSDSVVDNSPLIFEMEAVEHVIDYETHLPD